MTRPVPKHLHQNTLTLIRQTSACTLALCHHCRRTWCTLRLCTYIMFATCSLVCPHEITKTSSWLVNLCYPHFTKMTFIRSKWTFLLNVCVSGVGGAKCETTARALRRKLTSEFNFTQSIFFSQHYQFKVKSIGFSRGTIYRYSYDTLHQSNTFWY